MYLCKKIALLVFILFYLTEFVQAQMQTGAELNDAKIELRKESYFGININTHGWGFGYRRGNHVTGTLKRMLDFDYVSYHHPKEIKTKGGAASNTKSYYYGKLNNVGILRAGCGIQKVVYDAELPGALEVRFNAYAGGSMALLKPVYLQIFKPSPYFPDRYELVIEKYDANAHFPENIFGKAPFLKGINELKINPGVYGKAGLSFEFGPDDESVKIIEAGAMVDFHPKPIPVMAFNTSNPLIFSFYVTVSWGKRSNH